MSDDQLRTAALLKAYFVIQKYPLNAAEQILDTFIQQQYKKSLKDLCIELLLKLTFYKNDSGDLVLLFKEKKYDTIASLITYGNGAIQGSQVLKVALDY